jgi:hypothetical protein
MEKYRYFIETFFSVPLCLCGKAAFLYNNEVADYRARPVYTVRSTRTSPSCNRENDGIRIVGGRDRP